MNYEEFENREFFPFLCKARVVGSRVDVVTLRDRDQLVRVARFSSGFFKAMAGKKNQGSSMYYYL